MSEGSLWTTTLIWSGGVDLPKRLGDQNRVSSSSVQVPKTYLDELLWAVRYIQSPRLKSVLVAEQTNTADEAQSTCGERKWRGQPGREPCGGMQRVTGAGSLTGAAMEGGLQARPSHQGSVSEGRGASS